MHNNQGLGADLKKPAPNQEPIAAAVGSACQSSSMTCGTKSADSSGVKARSISSLSIAW
jgi:hypothetical protein